MPKRTVIAIEGRKYILLPYTGFRNLGIPSDPPAPLEAVPLFDSIEQSLVEPLKLQRDFDESLKLQGIAGVGALLRGIAGEPAADQGQQTKKLVFEDKLHFPFLFFRGERREEFGILPTAYRQLVRTPPPEQDRVLRKQARVEGSLARKITLATLLTNAIRLTPMQARAAARHYGAVSTLTDFSLDPRVAAYFGHPKYNPGERENLKSGQKPIGVIYGLSYDHLQHNFPVQGWTNEPGGTPAIHFYFAGTTIKVPYLTFDQAQQKIVRATCTIGLPSHFANMRVALRTASVPSIKRIARQEGLFIELVSPTMEGWIDAVRLWYLLDFLSDKWCYFRRDAQFEDPPQITAQTLFPADSRLLRMAVWPRS